jgi:hypothetical protein
MATREAAHPCSAVSRVNAYLRTYATHAFKEAVGGTHRPATPP